MNVDVVIPLYNGKKWIKETLDSVFSQTLKPNKVIVVDDGSTDGSYELVSKIPGIALLRNPNKVEEGPASARNLGFDQTTTPFVAFLDQDDVWHPDHLKILFLILKEYADHPVASSSFTPFEDGMQYQFDLSDKSIEMIEPWKMYPLQNFNTSPSFILYRSESISKVRWTVGCGGASDYSIYMKLAVSKPIIYCKMKTVAYRKHCSSHFSQLTANPLNFLSVWITATDDLLNYRLKYSPSKTEKLFFTRRNAVAHMIYNLALSIINNDIKLLKESAYTLESKLIGEQENYYDFTFSQLIAFLTFDFFKKKQYEKFSSCYEMLLDLWPTNAQKTRNSLMKAILEKRPGATFYRNFLFEKPHEIWRLLFVFQALSNKFIKQSYNSPR